MPIRLYTLLLLCALVLLVNAAPLNQTTASASPSTPSQSPHTLSPSIPNSNHNCTQPHNTTRPHCGPALGYDSLKKGGGRVGGWGRSPGVYVGAATSGTVGQRQVSMGSFLALGGLILTGGVVMA